jgi:hypothetical protein
MRASWRRPLLVAKLALLVVGMTVSFSDGIRAQNAVPPDLSKAIDDLGTKFNELASDKAKLDAAVKLLDAKIGAIRNKSDPAYIDAIAADLNQWVAGLSDGQKPAARDKLKTLIDSLDRLRDASDSDRAKRLLLAVVDALRKGKFSQAELEGLAKEQSIKDIGTELDKLLKDLKPGIHIISATYGNHRNGMVCDATGYFRGHCEGKSNNCPDTAAIIDGPTLCGYEPAPLAASGRNSARVRYQCLSFRLRPLDPLGCTQEGCGTTIQLRGKGQIICAPNS